MKIYTLKAYNDMEYTLDLDRVVFMAGNPHPNESVPRAVDWVVTVWLQDNEKQVVMFVSTKVYRDLLKMVQSANLREDKKRMIRLEEGNAEEEKQKRE